MEPKRKRLTFGLLIDWIVGWGDFDYYQSMLLSGLDDFARKNDINLICFVTGRLDSPYEWEKSRNILFEFVDKNKIDGLIVPHSSIGVYGTKSSILKVLESYSGIPIVTIGENYEGFHSVTVNNYVGMRQIIDHLIEVHNCRRIAFIKGAEGNKEAETRFNAYLDSLEAHNLEFDPELTYQGNFIFDSGSNAVKALVEKGIKFDSLAAANDNMAIGALIELQRLVGMIPENIPVVGFDDAETSKSHALTTVNQSFFHEAEVAAQMLFRIIQGEDVPMEEETPTEMIVRSSCGCFPEIVTNVTAEISSTASANFASIYESKRFEILSSVLELNHSYGYTSNNDAHSELTHYEYRLFDAFYEEFCLGKKNKFLFSLNTIIFWVTHKKMKLPFLHDLLSCMRKQVLMYTYQQSEILEAENLFQSARVQINDAIQRAESILNYLNWLQTEHLDLLDEHLMTDLECSSQMDLIYESVPKFGINKCYISLYEDPANPLEYSRLILAFRENKRFDTGTEGIVFRTLDLLPAHVLEDLYAERFSVLVQVLHQGDNLLGLSIFGIENKVNKAYEIIRHSLSVALKGSLLVKNVKNQALDLEKQVIKRTLELSQTNEKLINEITKRKTVEEQLKKALMDLEFYNKELQLQSIRDELTKLYNRRGFIAMGTEHLASSKYSGQGCMLLFADMDGLKQINDKFGHSEGDYAIIKTAEILNQVFRSTDIIGRLGGDEFTVLMVGALPQDETEIRRRLEYYCNMHNKTSNKPYDISLSFGTSYFDPSSSFTLEDLLNFADLKLYNEKQQKKLARLSS